MSSRLKAELSATCSTLGRMHKGEYLIEPESIESIKDLIRYLKRDGIGHDIRRYLGEAKVLQSDLIHIVKSCPENNVDLFDVTLRLLVNLTTPALLFYGEEVPTEKMARKIYLSLVGYGQEYKAAFCDVDFWNKVCGKLTGLFERDWMERSADDGIQIERILMLLRNVLQVPADLEEEKRPENDITVHDKILWALRQSQILELLLFVSSNGNEEQYYLNLLEIISLILREQNPKLLARCDLQLSATEKKGDAQELMRARELEKKSRNRYMNMRNFSATFVMKGVKSLSNNDVVCHKSLEKAKDFEAGNKKTAMARRNRIPLESERIERRSTFSVRLFLKEFSLEFLNCSFERLMRAVKSKLDSGKTLANDQTYYFWALKFFLDFATASDSDVSIVKDFLSTESFHFVQMNLESAFERLQAEKKKAAEWVRRIHLILKAYRSLLDTLLWMDLSKNPLTRSISREIKSQIFYVAEYREMTLYLLFRYDPAKFSISYLRDLMETTHLFVKLLEEYSKQTRLVVQKLTRRNLSRKKCKIDKEAVQTPAEKWQQIKDHVYDSLCSERAFPDIPPFDAALDVPIDNQKGRAMKRIQALLHEGKVEDSIGLLRSARQVWPENDYFGTERMSVEDEALALQEICLAYLEEVEGGSEQETMVSAEKDEKEETEVFDEETQIRVVEEDFDIMDYKKRLVNKKVVEGCGILLRNYKNNSDHTNHCVIKLLHRIGWECNMPALLFQASLFWTLLKISRDKSRTFTDIKTFTVNLLRKFRKHASQNAVVFLELLFWKENSVALEIQHGYQPYEDKLKLKKKQSDSEMRAEEEEDIANGKQRSTKKRGKMTRRKIEKNIQDTLKLLKEGQKPLLENASSVFFENYSETCQDARSKGRKEHAEEERDAAEPEEMTNTAMGEAEGDAETEIVEKKSKNEDHEVKDYCKEGSYQRSDEERDIGTFRLGNRKTTAISTRGASIIASKKRGRKHTEQRKDSDGSDEVGSKRTRCTVSDSDTENCNSADEGSYWSKIRNGGKGRRRRRLALIDSDSDSETNAFDGK